MRRLKIDEDIDIIMLILNACVFNSQEQMNFDPLTPTLKRSLLQPLI